MDHAHAREHPHQQPHRAREHSAAGTTVAMHAHAGHGDHAAMVEDFRRRFWLIILVAKLHPSAQRPHRGGATRLAGTFTDLCNISTNASAAGEKDRPSRVITATGICGFFEPDPR